MRDPSGRVALVTGGSGGIGAAVARVLSARGTRVATLDLSGDAGESALSIVGDVADSADVEASVVRVEQELGPIDILVCAAGIPGASLPTVDVTDEEWKRTMAVNADGVFYCNRAVLPGMIARGYGRIVNIASIAGKEGNPTASAYSSSKAAVIGLTKSLGKELAKQNITVNCITPAAVKTPIFDQVSQQHIDYMLQKIPMGRFGQVEEIASIVCWLCTEDASFSTGAVFDVSGGRATY